MVKALRAIVMSVTAAACAVFLVSGAAGAATPLPREFRAATQPPAYPVAQAMPPFPQPAPPSPFPGPGPAPFPVTVPPYPPPSPVRIPNAGVQALATGLPSPSHITVKGRLLIWSQAGDNPIEKMGVNGGKPVPMAMNIGVPENLFVAGRHVYWIDGDRVKDTDLDTGVTAILSKGKRNFDESAIATDGKNLYWINSHSNPVRRTINSVPLAGGESSVIAQTSREIVSLAFDKGFVYYEEIEDAGPAASGVHDSFIMKVPATGGHALTVVDAGLNGLTPTKNPRKPSPAWEGAGGIAVTNGHIYFSGADGAYKLYRVPVDGGKVSVVEELPEAAVKIVADAQNVYWADSVSISRLSLSGGKAVVLAGALHSPADIAVGDGGVYWTETVCCGHGQKGSIKEVPAAGGKILILAAGVDAPGPIALGGHEVFWGEGGTTGLAEGFGRIANVPQHGGGAVRTVASGISSDMPPIAVVGRDIFVADKFTIKRIPLSGGQAEKMTTADSNVADIAADGRNVYWIEDPLSAVMMEKITGGPVITLTTGRGPAGRLVVDSSSIYWVDHYDTIKKIGISSRAESIIGQDLGYVSDIAVSGINVFFLESNSRDIRKIPSYGGPSLTLVSFINPPGSITADMSNLYWVDETGVGEVSANGGPPEAVATNLASDPLVPNYIAMDGANIYWTEAGGGAIKKAPK